jgi:hypothetical protein
MQIVMAQNDLNMKLGSAAIVTVFLLLGCGQEVTLESQRWTYEKGVCNVTFKLKNHGNDPIDRNVRIVAHKLKDIGEGAVVDDITGERIITVKLRPYEEKEQTEILPLFPNRQPDMVVVNHYKAK